MTKEFSAKRHIADSDKGVMNAGQGFRECKVACFSTYRIGRCKERMEVVLCCQVWN